MSETPLLHAINIHKRFGTNEVLKGIDLDVARGEVVALIGSSGSGKTTFLRCVNMLEEYQEGQILLDGGSCSTRGQHCAPLQDRHNGLIGVDTATCSGTNN